MFRTSINPMKSIYSMLDISYLNCRRVFSTYVKSNLPAQTTPSLFRSNDRYYSTDIRIPVVSYEYVKGVSLHSEKMLIDVREPSELAETGAIPTSINIPLGDIQTALSWSSSQFKAKFNRDKPQLADEIIFYCKLGMRSEKAAIAATQLGYSNIKNYRGSWEDWAKHASIAAKK